jgi:hypothetical protein
MKAAHVTEYYTAYLEGSLPDALRAEVARHLDACPRCAEELEAMRALVATLHELPEAPLPADFAAGVRARMADRRPARPWLLRLPALAGGTLAAAVLALTIIVVQPYLHAPVSESSQTIERTEREPADAELKAFRSPGNAISPSPSTTAAPGAPPTSADPFAEKHRKKVGAPGPADLYIAPEPEYAKDALSDTPATFSRTDQADLNDKRLAVDLDATASSGSGGKPERSMAGAAVRPSAKPKTGTTPGADPGLLARTPTAPREGMAPSSATLKAAPPPAAALPGVSGQAGPGQPAPAPAGVVAEADTAVSTPSVMADQVSPGRTRPDNGTAMAKMAMQSSTIGTLTLHSIVLKGAQATVIVETAAAAPTDLVVRTIEPDGGDGQGFPLSPGMRTAAFNLPLQPGGSVVELSLMAGQAERAILVLPDRNAPRQSITLHPREEPITTVLRRLAVSGQLFIFCPPQFIEDKKASFTVRDAAPMVALSDLAVRVGYRTTKAGNIVTLAPRAAQPPNP